jgi:hypothetical protein
MKRLWEKVIKAFGMSLFIIFGLFACWLFGRGLIYVLQSVLSWFGFGPRP